MTNPENVNTTKYDEDYYIRGKESGKSLYDNYRWLPGLTIPMAETISDHLCIELDDTVLDFGCARGYLVKALVELGYENTIGCDVSDWARANCDEGVKDRIVADGFSDGATYDWIIAKDTLEHLTLDEVKDALLKFAKAAKCGVFIVVPLSGEAANDKYVVPEYEADITHVIRWPLWKWVQECCLAFGPEWEVSGRYRIVGVKDNYAKFEKGNGFITIRNITS